MTSDEMNKIERQSAADVQTLPDDIADEHGPAESRETHTCHTQAVQQVHRRIESLKQRKADAAPFSSSEVDRVVRSGLAFQVADPV